MNIEIKTEWDESSWHHKLSRNTFEKEYMAQFIDREKSLSIMRKIVEAKDAKIVNKMLGKFDCIVDEKASDNNIYLY